MSDSAGSPSQGGPKTPSDDAERAITEADIVQVSDGRLYAMSQSGSLAVVDLSTPGQLTLLGKTMLAGRPFEMYRRGSQLVTMSNNAVDRYGEPLPPAESEEAAYARGDTSDYYYDRAERGAAVIVLDVAAPAQMRTTATFAVPGEIADSRVVGDVLYLVTYESADCYRCATTPRTLVTSFDISDATNPREIDRLEFLDPPDLWEAFSKRSVVATPERLYVGGVAEDYVIPGGPAAPLYDRIEGAIDVVDITDPGGRLRQGAHIRVPGIITNRWQMDERDGVLRVVSQRGAIVETNGIGMPSIDTFQIDADGAFTPLGHTDLQLPIQEGLKAVRFDRDRAYAITFRNTDPLFTIDLRDPAAPQQRGELVMPGYVFHMEPRGDRLIGLGLDADDERGHLNVSLFDVSDLDRPRLLRRVPFGATDWTSEAAITQAELPEDQNRIQKAFRLLDDGTIVVPFSARHHRRALLGPEQTIRRHRQL
ncbi:MAG: beta-propeller domain-containing protein [Polyangiaceae bacterium]|nr:beta-propeller domain-containing protein [Polyangiaceae bacterium]